MHQEIEQYGDYFRALADRSYDAVTGFADTFGLRPPEWKPPMEAIESAFDHSWVNSPGWGNLERDVFRPYLEQWLAEQRVADFSHLAKGYIGWTANIFLGRLRGVTEPQILCVGAEARVMPHLRTRWNPLHLQPHALTIFVHRQGAENYRLAISRFPLMPMVPESEKPIGFADFMNEAILIGTPWKVAEGRNWKGKDICVLRHGAPVYSGAIDSLVFISDAAAKQHARDQWKSEYQQNIMRIIHENSERAGLPPSMRWIVEAADGSGTFVTRQAVEFPDPLHIGTPRSIVRVPHPHQAAGAGTATAANSARLVPR